MTPKDREDLDFVLTLDAIEAPRRKNERKKEHTNIKRKNSGKSKKNKKRQVDWVALSFVQRPEDILELKRLIGDKNLKVMAKLEKPVHGAAPIDDFPSFLHFFSLFFTCFPQKAAVVPGTLEEIVKLCDGLYAASNGSIRVSFCTTRPRRVRGPIRTTDGVLNSHGPCESCKLSLARARHRLADS